MGERRRWLCGGAAARHRHAVASGHRFHRCLPETLQARVKQPRKSPNRPVRIVSTRLTQPKKRVMSRLKPLPAVRPSGCRRREFNSDWDPVRRSVQEAARAQAG